MFHATINMEEKMWGGGKVGGKGDNNGSLIGEEAGQEVQPTGRRTDWDFSVAARRNDLPINENVTL